MYFNVLNVLKTVKNAEFNTHLTFCFNVYSHHIFRLSKAPERTGNPTFEASIPHLERIRKYFPGLTPEQTEQLARLEPLYRFWNEQINVISRQDMDNFYERHVLHSLAIARFIPFKAGSVVLDLGTGGGFPGIPLAILFPVRPST